MGDFLYRFVRFCGRPFRYQIVGLETFPGGPAVFVANHLGSKGPLSLCFSASQRFYPWVIGEMMSHKTAPGYIREDFIEPELHLYGRAGRTSAWLIGHAAAFLLNAAGCIPVDSHNPWSTLAFRRSLDVLVRGGILLIFPEDPRGSLDPVTGMRPFQCGFTGLFRMYRDRTGQDLPAVPAAVLPASKTIRCAEPLIFKPAVRERISSRAFCAELEESIGRMLQDTPTSAPEDAGSGLQGIEG